MSSTRPAPISLKTNLLITAALFLTLLAAVAVGDTLTYQTSMGKDSNLTVYVISPVENGKKVVAEYNVKQIRCVSSVTMSDVFTTKNWTYKSIQDNTDLFASASNDTVTLKGVYRNRKVNKRFTLNAQPWKQMFPLDLKGFVCSDSSTTLFSGISTIEIAPMQLGVLEAKKIGVERLNINGKEMDLVHVRVSPPGVISMFWHGDYWFEKSCGTFVKSISYDFPGAQPVISVLMN